MVPALLPRVASGDTVAVRECIARYGGLIWSLARRFSASHTDAEDAVQEIFLELWKNAGRFDPNVGTEVTFIAMIARRRLIDRRRRTRRDPRTEMLNDTVPNETMVSPELGAEATMAARAMNTLRPEQRQVLVLTACHGLTHEEVATHTGMPLGTVKAHARRGLLAVRAALGLGQPPELLARSEVGT